MAQEAYQFRPMTAADLPLIRRWLEAPHLARWWGDPDGAFDEIRQTLIDPPTRPYLILIDGGPVGYIQSYDIHAENGHPYQDQPPGTIGIDLSIGEAMFVGKGHGSRIADAFVRRLFAEGAPRVVIDPDPDNMQAIRAYAKAGFRPLDRRVTQYGPALIMARDAVQRTTAA